MPGQKKAESVRHQWVLADTHTLVWALTRPELLSRAARAVLESQELLVSVASLWELLLKREKPGALLLDPVPWWEEHVAGSGLTVLPIRQKHAIQLGRLATHHRDPFDRILIAQAMTEGAALVSKDTHMDPYGVTVIW